MNERRLGPEAKAVLREVYARHYALLKADPPKSKWQRQAREDEIEFGPLLSVGDWFDCTGDNAVRMRFQRAIQRLVAAGLVIIEKAERARHANIRLTAAGEAMVEAGAAGPIVQTH